MSVLTRMAGCLSAAAAIGLCCQTPAVGQIRADSATVIDVPAQHIGGTVNATGGPNLNQQDGNDNWAHILPTLKNSSAAVGATDNGPLLYHAGGSIMPRLNIYAIFWKPAQLQNGQTATMSAVYTKVLGNFAADYVGHAVSTITTQYYQTIGGVTTFISNLVGSVAGTGSRAVTYIDTQPYPASGCTDTATPGNCVTDAQLQTELQRVMTAKGFTGGMNKLYVIFTASGEGSCMNAASCAYTSYCGYHSHIAGTVPVIYAIIPYGIAADCDGSTSYPNGDSATDSAASTLSHEISESVTDPLGNAWFSALSGAEIGDLCNANDGGSTYDGGLANQYWNGHYYEIQREFDNHQYAIIGTGCAEVGP